ncbi:anti-sigma factor [Actinoplanes sp. NPDC026623]|uniref:anti-sigma factor n=1 Tax=Actinoplanes sp. NPDC026623 TaxID=3155610 RepID=UPI0033D0FA74
MVRTAPMIGGGRVTVASSQQQDAGVVSLRADEAPPADRAFQMWKIRGTGPAVSAGVLPAGQASTVQVVDGVPGNDVFAVSVEPAGGSKVPTVPRIVAQVPLT